MPTNKSPTSRYIATANVGSTTASNACGYYERSSACLVLQQRQKKAHGGSDDDISRRRRNHLARSVLLLRHFAPTPWTPRHRMRRG